ncbi:MAG: Myc-type, basic helix-loop-helix domain-containing protein, partial [Benjaminiella poitrasii]
HSTADQREKARRISHSAIERRRRERINDKILQLKQLIPTCRDQESLHKMSILQSAIEYIAYLQDVVQNHPRLSNDLLQGAHLTPKKTKSLLPKEVEPFTSQFSVQKGLKPIDLILSSTTGPLTPPHQHQEDETKHMSLQNILC